MILVGTLHTDWKGSERLERILQAYKPKIITIESPNFGNIEELVSRIETAKNQFRSNIPKHYHQPYKKLIHKAIDNFAFECTTSINYAKSSTCSLYFVDDYNIMKPLSLNVGKSYCPPLTLKADILKLANLPGGFLYPRLLELIYTRVTDIMYQNLPNLELKNASPFSDKDSEDREGYMTNEILKIRSDMHIGGLFHVFGEYPQNFPVRPLHRRLGSIVKKRIMLCDADKLAK